MLRKSLLLLIVFLFLGVVATPLDHCHAVHPKELNEELSAEEEEGSIFDRMIAGTLNALTDVLDAATGTGLDEMVFLQGVEHRDYLPWHNPEQRRDILEWFYILTAVIAPFFIFPVIVTAYKMIIKSGNPQDRAEAQQNILRWFLAVLMIALAPMFMFLILRITVILIDAIVYAYARISGACLVEGLGYLTVAETLVTGNILTTAVVRLAFVLFTVYLSILYLLRLLSLSIMLVFTPFVAIMFAIKKDTTAINIWLGEIASVSFMPVSHALVLCTILLFSKEVGWLVTLIFLYSVIPLSEVLRNSMMDILTRSAGWNEAGTAGRIMGAVTGVGMIAGVGRVAGAAFSGGKAGDTNASKDSSSRLDPEKVDNSGMYNKTQNKNVATGSGIQDKSSETKTISGFGGFKTLTTTVGGEQQDSTTQGKELAIIDSTGAEDSSRRTSGKPPGGGGEGTNIEASSAETLSEGSPVIKSKKPYWTPERKQVYGWYGKSAAVSMAEIIGGVVPGGGKILGGATGKTWDGAAYVTQKAPDLLRSKKSKEKRAKEAEQLRIAEIQQQAEVKAAERAERQEIYRNVQNKQPMSEKDYRSTLHVQAKMRVEDLRRQGFKLDDEKMEKRAHDDIDQIIHQRKVNNESFPSANEVYQRERDGSNEFAGRNSPFVPQKEFEEHLKAQQKRKERKSRYDNWEQPPL